MKITIRMDDITPGMDWGKFLRFKEILDENGVKPLIGVVPDNKDQKLKIDDEREDFWEYIRGLQQQGWVVAMHGFNHLYTTSKSGLFPIGNKSEFAGLPYHKQDEMIREGRRIFKQNGIITDYFMAPSHSFDKNTLKALKMNGFYRITDGFGKAPYKRDEMIFYPISVQRSRSLQDTSDGIVTFVYHANTMEDKDFDKLKKLFSEVQVVSFSEYNKLEYKDRSTLDMIKEYVTAKAKFTAVQLKKRFVG